MSFVCPVPADKCSGGNCPADDVRDKTAKVHPDPASVRACERRYLLSQGYKQLGAREFLTPQGTILILARKPGMRAKPGKRQVGSSSNRINAAGVRSW